MSKEKLQYRYEALLDLYATAFAGFPWFEILAQSEIEKRIQSNANQSGFNFIDYEVEGKLAGAIWYDVPSLEQLAQDRGQDLAALARQIMAAENLPTLVWEREVMVSPQQQKKGIATQLRNSMFASIQSQYGDSLILTRMRDDNVGIITVAQRVGFVRTGITRPSSQTPDFKHEFWYKVLKQSY
jgi:hypothetical protein